ncbi:MAG: siderophore-interacting protein [Acidimicrobiia bacterium]|nr:siderophore-interacting protein [Acidimicrobiia bacterium]
MTDSKQLPVRQEPPPFRTVTVAATELVSPHLQRIVLAGPELDGFEVTEPASSVRLLLPSAGRTELVLPSWTGNEFLLPDGARPAIRTLTPPLRGPAEPNLTLDVVLHDAGILTDWARTVEPGATVAVSGPGRGYAIDAAAPNFLLAGDESALPALSQVLSAIPRSTLVHVVVEVIDPDAVERLPQRDGVTIEHHVVSGDTTPGDAMATALAHVPIAPDTRVWVAGEAAAVQRVRREFFTGRGIPRSHCTIRGYWKAGRDGVDGT